MVSLSDHYLVQGKARDSIVIPGVSSLRTQHPTTHMNVYTDVRPPTGAHNPILASLPPTTTGSQF